MAHHHLDFGDRRVEILTAEENNDPAMVEALKGAFEAQRLQMKQAHDDVVTRLNSELSTVRGVLVARAVQLRKALMQDADDFNAADERGYFEGLSADRLRTELQWLEKRAEEAGGFEPQTTADEPAVDTANLDAEYGGEIKVEVK